MTPHSTDIRTAAEPGAVIAGHELVEVLKRSADGAAFRATAPDGTPVTMQVFRRPAEEREAARFTARAKLLLLSGLAHPALPQVLGFGAAPEGLWVASAEVQGASLRNLLAERVAPMRAVRLLREVADALDAAHHAGLAHGDLRPENVIVQMRTVRLVERALLVDFALAPASPRDPVAAERIPYSAPEVLHGAEPGPAADVFALAAVLYECMAGAPPFGQEGDRSEPEPLGSALPTSLSATIARGLAADPAARPASAAELMGEAAQGFLDPRAPPPWAIRGPAPTPAADSAGDAPPAPPAWRRRMLGALAAALVVGGAGTAGYAVGHESTSDELPAQRTAAAGVVSVAVPDGWERSRTGEDDARPSLARPVSLRRSNPPGRIAAGLAADRAAVLDPSRLVAEVALRGPPPRQVRLGRLEALRFEGPGPGGASILYVAPTTAGAATVACSGSRAAVAGQCAEAARGLAVRGARGYDPAAGIAWTNRLAGDMRRLRARRSAGLRRLRRATTRAGQGRRAGQIAGAYAASARRLSQRPAPPQAARTRRRVLARLLAADRAYRSLARAAGGGHKAAYRRAVRRIRRADRRLQDTLRAL